MRKQGLRAQPANSLGQKLTFVVSFCFWLTGAGLLLSFGGCASLGSAAADQPWQLLKAAAGLSSQAAPLPQAVASGTMLVRVGDSVFGLQKVADMAYYPRQQGQAQVAERVGVWLSPAGEVLRIAADGRIVASTGSWYADWQASRTSKIAAWADLLAYQPAAAPVAAYTRVRDVMPGAASGLQELVEIYALPAPRKRPALLQAYPAWSSLRWFEERSILSDPQGFWARMQRSVPASHPLHEALPAARFALAAKPNGGAQVVYSEQCLSAAVCLQLLAPAQP